MGGGYPSNWFTLYGLGAYGAYTCSNTYDNNQGLYTWSLDFTSTELHLNSTQGITNGLPLWKAQ